jgi:hypothetical protein
MVDLKKNYAVLAEKYKLPDYNTLNKEFDIEDIGETDFFLNKIRAKIVDKIDSYLKVLEGFLQPDTTLSNLYESKYIDEDTKERVYQIFKTLMKFYRYSIEVALINDEAENANFIKSFYSAWISLKPELIELMKSLGKLWESESSIKEDLTYLG